jgi:DNA ligase (NAD+)
MEMTKEDLLKFENVGEKVATAVFDYFSDSHNQIEIQKLLDNGVQPQSIKTMEHHGHLFNGKTFVLTGTLEKYTRTDAATLVKERGGKVTDSVSKKTDYLLAGENAGSKLEKAQSLSIKILNEKDFENLL